MLLLSLQLYYHQCNLGSENTNNPTAWCSWFSFALIARSVGGIRRVETLCVGYMPSSIVDEQASPFLSSPIIIIINNPLAIFTLTHPLPFHPTTHTQPLQKHCSVISFEIGSNYCTNIYKWSWVIYVSRVVFIYKLNQRGNVNIAFSNWVEMYRIWKYSFWNHPL